MLTIHDRPFPAIDRSEAGHWESQCCCQAARAGLVSGSR
jgi:IS30 family transposase